MVGPLVPLFARALPCGGWRGLVGLLFEICIVDASIFVMRPDGDGCPGCVLACGGCRCCWGVLRVCNFFSCCGLFPYGPGGGRVFPAHSFDWGVGRVFFGLCLACETCVVLTLLRQAMKGTWWMPWHQEPMKDVGACDKPWGVGNQAVIRGCPNGETQHESCRATCT